MRNRRGRDVTVVNAGKTFGKSESVYHSSLMGFALAGRRCLAAFTLLSLCATLLSGCRTLLPRQYEYDEEIQLSLDGSAVVYINGSIPALVAPILKHAIDVASKAGVRTVLNLSPVAELPAETLKQLTTLIVNEHEAAQLVSDWRHLLRLGPHTAVVTLGERGVAVVLPAGVKQVPSIAVDEVVDTTGAGDAFAGAFSARLAAGDRVVVAAEYAVKVAALSVTKAGAQPSYPTADEVSSLAAE